jgi:hypothetical protein
MARLMWLAVTTVSVVAPLIATGCTPRQVRQPEEDLTPFEQLVRRWTNEYRFRRTIGGDDLVSEQASITEQPTHEEVLFLEATLFSDTLVHADIQRLCEEDTAGTACDTVTARYERKHQLATLFRVEIYALATLSQPFELAPLTMYITDQDGIDYEPRRSVFSNPVSAERSYLDREVKRYDPYTSWEYRVYNYRQGYEYQSTGHATLYFDRINVIGNDLLGPGARLTLSFRKGRSELAAISWDLDKIRSNTALRRSR